MSRVPDRVRSRSGDPQPSWPVCPESGKAAEAPAAADVNEAAEEEAAVAKKDDGTGSADAEMEFDEDSVDNDIDADADDSAGLISNDLDEDEDILPGIRKRTSSVPARFRAPGVDCMPAHIFCCRCHDAGIDNGSPAAMPARTRIWGL